LPQLRSPAEPKKILEKLEIFPGISVKITIQVKSEVDLLSTFAHAASNEDAKLKGKKVSLASSPGRSELVPVKYAPRKIAPLAISERVPFRFYENARDRIYLHGNNAMQ
jgi:hypothetical protein